MGAKRLQMEYIAILKRKEFDNFIAQPAPNNIFEWHFVIFGLTDCPYENGYYHGTLSFPTEYPFKPPRIKMITPSGRFEVNRPICMSFSDFHPEMWSSNWGVSTIVIGLISFMNTDEMTTGGVRASHAQRLVYARDSIAYNFDPLKNHKFTKIFGKETLEKIGCTLAGLSPQKKVADILKISSLSNTNVSQKDNFESAKEQESARHKIFLVLAGFFLIIAYLIAS